MTTTTTTTTTDRRRGHRVVVLLVASLSWLVACGDDGAADQDPSQVLSEAKQALDETSGVTLSLTAPELPDDVDGVLEATGVATHAPAFDGDLVVMVNGLEVDVPVVSVDGVVYAQLPFTTSFAQVDPGDYGAPDPARLMDPETGLSAWLTAATDVEAGDRVRDGSLVLSTYTGSLPGEVIGASIPSADTDADFPATFRIDEDGLLRSVEVSGPFYGAEGSADQAVDYTVRVDDYGTEQVVTVP